MHILIVNSHLLKASPQHFKVPLSRRGFRNLRQIFLPIFTAIITAGVVVRSFRRGLLLNVFVSVFYEVGCAFVDRKVG